ncbi:ROK family protein [Streptomyces sp. T028]|uniref:ROK family protein n=1 Tax=Streptomyces sp. T028 TaxID=3394379 RepID=UPI003A888512
MSEALLLVIKLESNQGQLTPVLMRDGNPQLLQSSMEWDPPEAVGEDSGPRLAEEVARRIRHFTTRNPGMQPRGVAVTLPGTLNGTQEVLSSKRLGIFERINFSEVVMDAGGPHVHLYHDTECIGVGEVQYGGGEAAGADPDLRKNFCYLLVDEGIGSKIFIDGTPLAGAGSAGHLGRLIVQPDGAYNETFASRGPLEVFSSRPWVSSNMVGLLRAERGKVGLSTTSSSAFRRFLQAASDAEWTSLSYEQMNAGIRDRDPIATAVLEDAAKYLGLALNAVITITHPPRILLGGGMITDLDGFADSVIGHARRFSWELAWNRVSIRKATLGRKAQLLGAAALLASTLSIE